MMTPARTLSTVVLLVFTAVLAGCGGGGANGSVSPIGTDLGTTTLEVRVMDVTGMAIGGAAVTVTAGSAEEHVKTTDGEGIATFAGLPVGATTISVDAVGFETVFESTAFNGGPQAWGVQLDAENAWAIGRAVVLGTRLVERSSDGSAMTFSVDLTVIDEYLEVLQTLTSADFSVVTIDCGWGGPRDCASDAEGNHTGNLSADGGAHAFELHPATHRHPYLAGVLVERSHDVCWNWDQRTLALKSFFAVLGGNDMAGLMTVQTDNGVPTITVHGPFTNDGTAYLDVLDDLVCSEENPPALLDSLVEALSLTAATEGFGLPDAERHVVVLATAGLTASEVEVVAELARESGVHISSVPYDWNYYGLPEAAVRTGGFASHISDWQWRDAGMVFGALDQVLAGSLPFYRMQFRVTSGEGAFVPGGNAKVHLRIDVPTPIPHRGVLVALDVAIP